MRACNRLGEQYTLKSELEHQMNQWREKLVEIALDEKQCTPENEQLLEDIDAVKGLLRKDDTQVRIVFVSHAYIKYNMFILSYPSNNTFILVIY